MRRAHLIAKRKMRRTRDQVLATVSVSIIAGIALAVIVPALVR